MEDQDYDEDELEAQEEYLIQLVQDQEALDHKKGDDSDDEANEDD